MLIEFSVKNFRSIKEEQTLSMVAGADTKELPGNVFPLTRNEDSAKRWKDTRLLKSAVIYGANASGKSNLLEALRYLCDQIGKTKTLSITHSLNQKAETFKLDAEWRAAPSEFRIVFTTDDDGTVYEYFVKIQFLDNVVLEEKLDFYPKGRQKRLFDRTLNPDLESSASIVFPRNNLKGVRGLSGQTASDALFLSVAAAFNQPVLTKIRTWFAGINSVSELDPMRFTNLHDQRAALFEDNEALKKRMLAWLFAADLGIKDFESANVGSLYSTRVMGDDGKSKIESRAFRELIFLHGGMSEEFIKYVQESSGTRRWVNLFIDTYRAIENGSLIFIDEISADLHPYLSAYFLALFHDPRFNPRNAQLICTTHHSSLLSGNILRRDQIWFAEKNGEGASQYYSLLDYAPRKDKAIMKGYLAGEYGAVPDLSAMDSLFEKMGL